MTLEKCRDLAGRHQSHSKACARRPQLRVEKFIGKLLVDSRPRMRTMKGKSNGGPFPVCIMPRDENEAPALPVIFFEQFAVGYLHPLPDGTARCSEKFQGFDDDIAEVSIKLLHDSF